MGRGFWVLDNVATLRDGAFDGAGDELLLFEPQSTIRYRNVYRGQSANGVPDYPPPAAIIDYYLPAGIEGPVRLEIVDSSGDVVNAYESTDEAAGDDEVEEDMALSQARVIADQSLSAEAGANRFRWDMTHLGAWHEDEDDRYKRGPDGATRHVHGAPDGGWQDGRPAARTHCRSTRAPHRARRSKTSMRRLPCSWYSSTCSRRFAGSSRPWQRSTRRWRHERDELSQDEAARLLVVTDVLDQVRAADIIYPQPMLVNQVSFLYNMISRADQAPGVEAADQYTTLVEWFARLKEQYEAGT